MKKVYILYDWDVNEVIAVSEDRDLLCELMCDYFFDDTIYQWYWEQTYQAPTTDYQDACRKAKNIWIDMIEWYNDYIGILEEEVIK